ncbi:MAG: hypothetical protein K5880_14380 [Hydrogenophaga sp.]|nr:hypothetical protein [Hydrogenophaga sp.]
MTYELSAEAAEALLAQLNGRKELAEGWQFVSPGDMQPKPPGVRGGSERRRTLEDLEAEAGEEEEEPADDASFVAEKKASLREQGVLGDEDSDEEASPRESTGGPVEKALGGSGNRCSHMNKGRIQTTMRGKKRLIYRRCNDCRKDIPEITSEARQQYMSGKTPQGVNIRDL